MTTVLVIDDEFGLTEALCEVLGDEGFHVLVARNGSDGMKRIGEQRPDLVVLDYMMPVLDGRGVLQALSADPDLQQIPVLLISAIPQSSLPADCKPTAFLHKPFTIEALLGEIRRLLDGRSSP